MSKKKTTQPEEILPPAQPAEPVHDLVQDPAQDPAAPPATIDQAQIAAICGGYHGAPFEVLGPHVVEGKGLVVRAFRPLDAQVFVLDPAVGTRTELAKVDPAGFFEGAIPGHAEPFAYRLIVADAEGNEYELEDPFRFRD